MLLNNARTSTETRLDQGSRLRELDDTILSARQSLDLHTSPDPFHSETLDELAKALSMRFQEAGQCGDLDEAITLYQRALELRPSPDPLRPDSLNNLSKVFLMRYAQRGQPSDLDQAISLPRQALELQSPTHPLRSTSLHNLALAHFRQFERTGQQSDIEESISLHRRALILRAPPHILRSASLGGLANALVARYMSDDRSIDLDEALSLHRQALELQPLPHPDRFKSLSNLALLLCIRFGRQGQLDDLDDAISLNRQVLDLQSLTHSTRSMALSNLATALCSRFRQEGQRNDLAEAILLHRQALDLRILPHPDRSMSLSNLSVALLTQFEQYGHQLDLDEAIFLQRQALDLRPLPHPYRSMSLSNLAAALQSRFEQEGRRSDLDEAILLKRQGLDLRISPHPDRSMSLSNLAGALLSRFEQEGRISDLDEAISLDREALELLPSAHPDRFRVICNLAHDLWTRFEKEARQTDLNEAISLQREALSLDVLPNPRQYYALNNLANSLRTRSEQESHQADLDEAISLHRKALNLQTLSHSHRSDSLNDLANALRTQFEKEGRQTDLKEAILLYRQALELRPTPHPDQSWSLHDLGIALIHAHSLTGNSSDYLDEAMRSFRSATQCHNQAASLHLRIAHTWIKHAVLHGHKSAIDAYHVALLGLPKLAALAFDVKSRQEALLTDSDGLARDASRFAIQVGQLDKAIEFLEAGRAIFWSQFLSLRSPFEQLYDIAPELAVKLRDTASALEMGSHRSILANAAENRTKLGIDQETARLNRLNEEWSKALDEVRQLNGFEDFLQPRSLSALQVAASDGPVVILVANNDGSDALILTSVNVRTIHLPGLPNQELQNLVHLIRRACPDSRRSQTDNHLGNTNEFSPDMVEMLHNWLRLKGERGMRYAGEKDPDTYFRFVLENLWNKVVWPVIEILGLKKSADSEPPLIHWCPTGIFSFVPIHAAGCYDDNLPIECASDYFVSSYIPTIGALLTQHQTPTKPFKMMVVIQSRELPSTTKELEKIEQHVSNDHLIKLGVPGHGASVEEVASRLSDVAVVHFSCHGTQDQSNPLDSGLKLEDGYLRVSRIMQEKIQNGALAFLCACETAMGDDKLPDEAMSLGASLLFSGFRRVVATMWAMRDEDGPVIADAFYKELCHGPDGEVTGEPDATKSAYALHMAVKKLRAEKVSFSQWVPFIHMGK